MNKRARLASTRAIHARYMELLAAKGCVALLMVLDDGERRERAHAMGRSNHYAMRTRARVLPRFSEPRRSDRARTRPAVIGEGAMIEQPDRFRLPGRPC